jgi:hypothetical protein
MIAGRIVVGGVYRFHQLSKVLCEGMTLIDDVEGCRYRVLALANDGRTRQELVIYQGLEGPDDGKMLVCTPWDWSVHFRPEVLEMTAVAEHESDPAEDKPGWLAWSSGTEIDTRSKSAIN